MLTNEDISLGRSYRKQIIPDSTIACHIYVEFIGQAIHLFRCHTTVAEHPDLIPGKQEPNKIN